LHPRSNQSVIVNDCRAADNSVAEWRKSRSDCAKGKLKSRNYRSVRRNGFSAHVDYGSAILRSRVSHGPYILIP
jgi:hypothetical protein